MLLSLSLTAGKGNLSGWAVGGMCGSGAACASEHPGLTASLPASLCIPVLGCVCRRGVETRFIFHSAFLSNDWAQTALPQQT